MLAGAAWLLTVLVGVPALILAVECAAALTARRENEAPAEEPPRLAVLVPTWNEEATLAAAVGSVLPELGPRDRCVVVAHNCDDRSPEIARRLGAELVEVRDDGRRGKPAAVDAGLRLLDGDPPEIVAVVDADCRVRPGAIRALAAAAARHGGPVQGVYLFASADDGLSRASGLAVALKNWIRPLGLDRLGLPCLLTGSGFACPFAVLRGAPHGEGSIAEDYQLSIDLALRGHPTRFAACARVDSSLPTRRESARSQRRRWEHGHLDLTLHTALPLLRRALAQRSPDLAVLALDLLVPPLSFLVASGAVAALAGALAAWGGAPHPLLALGGVGLVATLAVLAACVRFCGGGPTLAALASAPGYLVWKLPLYLRFWTDRERRWRGTPRDSP